jgi:type II secretory pathway pseudopilin PulG
MKKNIKNKSGYTLVETMIAVSIFIIIVTVGMGALLNADALYNKSKDMRSIMDNLSFTIEDISRNLRTGYNYQCIPSAGSPTAVSTPTNGLNCMGIEFEPSGGGNPWAYEVITQGGQNIIQKAIYNGSSWVWVQLTPKEVTINTTGSLFSVFGALPPSANDFHQPFVNIHLVGTITYKAVITSFSLQTSISQREIDI